MSSFFPSKPRRYLIAIGSPHCPNMKGFDSLKNVENDVERITELFEKQGYKRELSDQITIGATSDRIKNRIVSWFSSNERKPDDLVVIYYAGHGDDGLGNFSEHYLLTVESNPDELQTTAIATEQFAKTFFQGDSNRNPKNILLILDTCYANVGGRQISQLMNNFQDVTSKSSGFWVICSSDDNTQAGDGDFVEALCNVMNPEREELQKCGDFISIETLVSRINQHFKKNQKAQTAIARNFGLEEATTFFRNPLCIDNDDTSSQPIAEQEPPNWCSQLVDCLWSLDYDDQSTTFRQNTKSSRVAAIIVQAKDRRIQNWLVKRLFNQLPNVRNARVFTLTIPAHPLWKNRDFNEFWRELGNYFECEPNPTTVINRLVEIYQEKSLILAMYELPDSSRSSRSQKLQQQILKDFWQPLVQAIGHLPNKPKRSRLVLFLAEGATKASKIVQDSTIPIRLTPFTEITLEDLEFWLDSSPVLNALHQIRSEDEISLLIEEDIQEWNTDPAETLEQICYIFDLENGIAEIESEWRLVG